MTMLLDRWHCRIAALFWLALASAWSQAVRAEPIAAPPAAGESAAEETAAQRGYRLLTTKNYLPPDFDQELFDRLWTVWEEPARSAAEQAEPAQRRRMAFERYGLAESPERPGGVAWQYVDDGQGGWVMNCLACHGGTVRGRVVPGLPNSTYALATLTEDVRALKWQREESLGHMDRGGLIVPLGESIGTTNAVMFGKLLMAFRDADLNVVERLPPLLLHHDHDAPPWWNVRKKTFLYSDGGTQKDHRALMQFLLIPQNGPERFHEWESDYADILAWIESLEPPVYDGPVDLQLAAAGRIAFERTCSECHGTYDADPASETYPNRVVPLEVVGTDEIRLKSIGPTERRAFNASWFGHYGELACRPEPGGYVAPPLDGIWASAPYFHNGAVPTLWHVLYPAERPVVWRRTLYGYDDARMGLEIVVLDDLPAEADTPAQRRTYFDTRLRGKSAAGHPFAEQLSADERQAVLEYLKTL